VIIKSKTAITAITIKIPTPTPALKIPFTMEQLDKVSKRKDNNEILIAIFCMR
jgi:hypothetical protein